MTNKEITEALVALLAEVAYNKRNSVEELRDKLSAVEGHLSYAIDRMRQPR